MEKFFLVRNNFFFLIMKKELLQLEKLKRLLKKTKIKLKLFILNLLNFMIGSHIYFLYYINLFINLLINRLKYIKIIRQHQQNVSIMLLLQIQNDDFEKNDYLNVELNKLIGN